jgi:DNA polymerase III delta subunit
MIKRTGYLENEEISMYALMGYVNTLCALEEYITMEQMERVVPSYYKEDVFCLAKLICSRDVQGLRRQAEMLRGTEIETLSALLREFRISYKAKYFSLKETGASYSAFLKKDKEYLSYGIHVISGAVAGIAYGF